MGKLETWVLCMTTWMDSDHSDETSLRNKMENECIQRKFNLFYIVLNAILSFSSLTWMYQGISINVLACFSGPPMIESDTSRIYTWLLCDLPQFKLLSARLGLFSSLLHRWMFCIFSFCLWMTPNKLNELSVDMEIVSSIFAQQHMGNRGRAVKAID